MRDDAWRTLFHPFEAGHLEMPGSGQRALFVGAEPGFRQPEGFAADLAIAQGFRPAFLALERQGHAVSPRPLGDGYDLALVLAGRHRGRNENWIRDAASRVRPGGLVVVASSKKAGADSLRKRLGRALPLQGYLSKYHGIVFWFERPVDMSALSGLQPQEEPLVEGRYFTAPGMFSHGRADPGSRFLAGSLPSGFSGKLADLGAGWGYLAARVAETSPGLEALHLYEADFESCEAAKTNLAHLSERLELGVFWCDLASESLDTRYDAIVMNPPFHETGRGADPEIGAAMINAAGKALRNGGKLFMVANSALPYEPVLARNFSAFGETCREGGFKVLWARK